MAAIDCVWAPVSLAMMVMVVDRPLTWGGGLLCGGRWPLTMVGICGANSVSVDRGL